MGCVCVCVCMGWGVFFFFFFFASFFWWGGGGGMELVGGGGGTRDMSSNTPSPEDISPFVWLVLLCEELSWLKVVPT